MVANRDGVDSDRSGGMMVHFICGAWYIFMRLYSIHRQNDELSVRRPVTPDVFSDLAI